MVARHHRRRWGCFLGPMGIGEAGGDAGGGQSQSLAFSSCRWLGERSVGPACHWRLLIAYHMLILQVRKSFDWYFWDSTSIWIHSLYFVSEIKNKKCYIGFKNASWKYFIQIWRWKKWHQLSVKYCAKYMLYVKNSYNVKWYVNQNSPSNILL